VIRTLLLAWMCQSAMLVGALYLFVKRFK